MDWEECLSILPYLLMLGVLLESDEVDVDVELTGVGVYLALCSQDLLYRANLVMSVAVLWMGGKIFCSRKRKV